MYGALLHAKDAGPEDFKCFRYIVSGGEPLPDAVFTRFRERFGVTINEGYGLTETAPVTNWCRPHEWRAHSVGRPLPEVIERIVDLNTGRTLARTRRRGSHQGPERDAGLLPPTQGIRGRVRPQGFFRTGDIGRWTTTGTYSSPVGSRRC